MHPPYFSNNDYRPLPRTPPQNGGYAYYSPRQYSYTATPVKGHTRRTTADATTFNYTSTYSTPLKTTYYSKPEFSSPAYYASAQSTPQRKSDHVSGYARTRADTRYSRVPADVDGKKQRKYSSSKHYSSRSQYVYDVPSDRSFEYLPRYEQYEARPPPYKRHPSYHESRADHRYYYDQMPIYTAAEPAEKTRPRRASHAAYTAKPKPQPTTQMPRRPSTATKSPPKATDMNREDAGIPKGYCIKNWDPTEEPILLLGSAFDANSLGKWIYDWTIYFYGPSTPMSDVAGDLWLLLIQLAGKIKRGEEAMSRIRQTASRDLVDDFIVSGDRLWDRFKRLLKVCEAFMVDAAKKETKGAKLTKMSQNSGCEFVASIFGRDRELERTEKLMTSMRLWSMRFDANCEGILRNPSA